MRWLHAEKLWQWVLAGAILALPITLGSALGARVRI